MVVEEHILPDVLEHGLRVVICGTAVAEHSARTGSYYAGQNNRFWSILFETGLTSRLLHTTEFKQLLSFGIGLTDMAKSAAGVDSKIRPQDYDVAGLADKLGRYRPQILCFNGKTVAQIFFGRKSTADIPYGVQPEKYCGITLFVAPSTSGAARRYWHSEEWHELARISKTRE